MRLLVGLGNPGAQYARNRHNVGFMLVEAMAHAYRFTPWRASKFFGETAEGEIGGQKVLALKPMTFMNESGKSVAAAANFYKIAPQQVVVLHDELDIAPGHVRIKQGGGHGGHNGLRSIDQHLGLNYWRVRLGVGHPGDKARVVGHVLGDFRAEERPTLELVLKVAADAAPLLFGAAPAKFAEEVMKITAPPPPPRPKPQRKTPAAATDAAPSSPQETPHA